MAYVHLIYGLAFFSLGFAVALYPKALAHRDLERNLLWVAAFGFLNAAYEWMAMFVWLDVPASAWFHEAEHLIGTASYAALLGFGLTVEPLAHSRLRLLPLPLLALWSAGFLWQGWDHATADAAARYLMGLPASAAAVWAFANEARHQRRHGDLRVARNLAALSGLFGLYLVVGAAIPAAAPVGPARWINDETFFAFFGVPIQIVRAVCAMGMAHFIVDILRHLRREMAAELEHHRRNLEEQVQRLRGLLPICAWCKKIRDDSGYWSEVEAYISRHSEATFTHSVCPACFDGVVDKVDEHR